MANKFVKTRKLTKRPAAEVEVAQDEMPSDVVVRLLRASTPQSDDNPDQPGPSRRKRGKLTMTAHAKKMKLTNRRIDEWLMTEEEIEELTPAQLDIFDEVMTVMMNADGGHVIEMIHGMETNISFSKDVDGIINRMFDEGYRRRAEVHAERQIAAQREFLLDDANFDVTDFLRETPDPETTFNDRTITTSALYREHLIVYLLNEFQYLPRVTVETSAQISGYLLLPCGDMVRQNYGIAQIRMMPVVNVRQTTPWPAQIDEQFFYQLQYLRNTDVVEQFQEEERGRYLTAQCEETTVTCTTCLKENIPESYMLDCKTPVDETHGHNVCRECVRQHAITQINDQQQDKVECVEPDCKREYTMEQLGEVLSKRLIAILTARRDVSQILKAGIENVMKCPFCDYLEEIADVKDKVFTCRNPSCQRRSCISCGHGDHVPLQCGAHTNVARDIENHMANAIIRICPNKACNIQCIKSDGCNSMTCPKCKTQFCYVCNKLLEPDNYFHFNREDGTGCEQFTEVNELHERTARRAGEERQRELARVDPEAANVVIDQLIDKEPTVANSVALIMHAQRTFEQQRTQIIERRDLYNVQSTYTTFETRIPPYVPPFPSTPSPTIDRAGPSSVGNETQGTSEIELQTTIIQLQREIERYQRDAAESAERERQSLVENRRLQRELVQERRDRSRVERQRQELLRANRQLAASNVINLDDQESNGPPQDINAHEDVASDTQPHVRVMDGEGRQENMSPAKENEKPKEQSNQVDDRNAENKSNHSISTTTTTSTIVTMTNI